MKGFTTKAIHSGYESNEEDGAVIPPLHLTTTFDFHKNKGKYDYSRTINPTRITLEKTLAALEDTEHGLVFASGSAVLAAVVSLLKPNEAILFSTEVYGGTYRYIVQVAAEQGVKYVIADLSDSAEVKKALADNNISIVWLETPSNPMLKVVDVKKLADLAHEAGAKFIVDNTFATQILQQPIKLGADAVAYSTTKFTNGHSDSVGGAIMTSDQALYDRLRFIQNAAGNMLSPFDSWLTLRGLKTLEIRVAKHIENADAVVKLLQEHSAVERVHYPGLGDASQQAIVEKQMSHPGAMVSFELQEGLNPDMFIEKLQHIPLAESLGGIETLLDHPASMTHGAIPKEEREKIGLSDGLFRLSIGIENVEDVTEDITRALEHAQQES